MMRKLLGLILSAMIGAAAVRADDAPSASSVPAAQLRPARAVGLEGAPNFRDIGGYSTDDGRHIRWGRVYRSSELSKLTSADAQKVDELHLAAVIDLRTAGERTQSPTVWLHRPGDVYESPKPSLAPVMQTILRDAQTGDGARKGMDALYADMPQSYSAEYAAMFHRLAKGEVPLLVHCSAGKDRTGVAVAVLLASVGVPRQTIVGDYSLTERLVPMLPPAGGPKAPPVAAAAQASTTLASLPEVSRRALWRSDPEYVSVALESIDREYGSVDAYVRTELGITDQERAAIRRELTE